MKERTPPMAMANKLVRLLAPERPDYQYLKKVFEHTRRMLAVKKTKTGKKLPDLLTDTELLAFYDAAWHTQNSTHLILIKLLVYTGMRNAELAGVRLQDVDLKNCQIRVEQGKGKKDRYVLIPKSFKGELGQYISRQRENGAEFLLESNRHQQFSTRRVRQIIKEYATVAGIEKRVYPHLFRHQIITFLTKQGIISPKLQLISGHADEKSLAIYRDLALSDVVDEYEQAMQRFPLK
ncbi:MAG TPA: tyrosine-type recombinase/integrase [Candidatus Obscuribacterales bacterium]